MTDSEIYNLYVLQSKNVRRLKQAKSSLIKDVNASLRKNDSFQVEIKTKLLALLFCTLSEAQFIQIVHTPKGFAYSEIQKIKLAKNSGLENGWKTMIDLALAKVGDWNKNHDLKKRRKTLHDVVVKYIISPSLLRNKIAHGQWEIALNRENTAENQDLTAELLDLNLVEVTRWFEIHQYLGMIIRDLIQSPKVGFHNNYWTNLTDLEQYILTTKNWTMASKKAELVKKAIKFVCPQCGYVKS